MKLELSNSKVRVIKNIVSLLVLQGTNYIFPLVTIPYLLGTIGIEYFGLISFATAIITYFLMISDYGFNLSATQKIAIYRNNSSRINQIFSSILIIKLIIVSTGFLILLTLLNIIPRLEQDKLVYIYTYGIVVGQSMVPLWLFQGMESMKYMTYMNFISKGIALGSILLFVNSEHDFLLVPILTSLGYIIAGMLSLLYAMSYFQLKFYFPKTKYIIFYLKDGWHIFLSRIFANLYSTTNIVILGFLSNNIIVGYYSAVNKIIAAISQLFQPLNQALYPYLAVKYKNAKSMNNIGLFKTNITVILKLYLLIAFLLYIIINILKFHILDLLIGDLNSYISLLFIILSIRLILYPFGPLLTNTLIILNQKKAYLKVMYQTVMVNFLIVPILIYYFQGIGLAIGFIAVILIHVILLYREYRNVI